MARRADEKAECNDWCDHFACFATDLVLDQRCFHCRPCSSLPHGLRPRRRPSMVSVSRLRAQGGCAVATKSAFSLQALSRFAVSKPERRRDRTCLACAGQARASARSELEQTQGHAPYNAQPSDDEDLRAGESPGRPHRGRASQLDAGWTGLARCGELLCTYRACRSSGALPGDSPGFPG